jgi:hypothetical protein
VPSYEPIVGGGAEAACCTIARTRALNDGDLLLIDAGAYQYQCSHRISPERFPVSGRYSAEQRALYDMVLAALGDRNATRGRPTKRYHAPSTPDRRAKINSAPLGAHRARICANCAYRRYMQDRARPARRP